MENIKIALISEDQEYAKALGLGLLHVCRTFLIRIFLPQGFETKVTEMGADLILWDDRNTENEATKRFIKDRDNLVHLAEKPSMVRKDFSQKKLYLYRYGCAQSFVADLFEIYEKLTDRHPVNVARQDIRVFTFASWEGGAGCTTAAVAVGRELCRYHQKRTLYLSLEEVESTENFFVGYSGAKPLGRYLYHLFRRPLGSRDKRTATTPFLEGYVIRDEFGLESFAPTRGRNPLRELSPEEFFIFIDSLMKSGRYDVILLDIGMSLSPIDMAAIELAERVGLIASAHGSTFREAQYMQYLICRCSETLLEKFVKALNRITKEELSQQSTDIGASQSEDSILPCNLYLGKSRYFFDEKKGKRLAEEGAFQRGITELTESLLNPLTES